MPMMRNKINLFRFKPIDLIPAFSGLIGKTALASSFAVVWASQFAITNPDFVFENVRLEIIIGSIITLLVALLLPNTAPCGTLAPLIVLVPSMAAFGVHPLILSISVGILGILAIKTTIFHKLIALSGMVSKASLTLTIGISGVILSTKNLYSFFAGKYTPFFFVMITLIIVYLLLRAYQKLWLIVPFAAVISILVSICFRMSFGRLDTYTLPNFNPSTWWVDLWGIGYGFEIQTIVKTIPFACFVILLWAADTVSINAMLESNYKPGEKKEEINLDRSIIVTSIRNMIGGLLGGAQTGALWRSFLIPLFMVKRPLQPASILLGLLGIIAGFTAIPVKILSFPPLIWSVLLFGIFLPFAEVGFRNLKSTDKMLSKAAIVISTILGVIISPILTWIGAFLYEQLQNHYKKYLKMNN